MTLYPKSTVSFCVATIGTLKGGDSSGNCQQQAIEKDPEASFALQVSPEVLSHTRSWTEYSLELLIHCSLRFERVLSTPYPEGA